VFFNQIKAALVSIRDLFKEHYKKKKKILPTPTFIIQSIQP